MLFSRGTPTMEAKNKDVIIISLCTGFKIWMFFWSNKFFLVFVGKNQRQNFWQCVTFNFIPQEQYGTDIITGNRTISYNTATLQAMIWQLRDLNLYLRVLFLFIEFFAFRLHYVNAWLDQLLSVLLFMRFLSSLVMMLFFHRKYNQE